MGKMKRFLVTALLALTSGVVLAQEADSVKNKKYVKVDSSSPDAVITDGTDFFESKPLCVLIKNQLVTVLDESDGEYVKIRATCKGKTVEGWVKKRILVAKPIQIKPSVSPANGVNSASMAAPASVGHGIPPPPEDDPVESDVDDSPQDSVEPGTEKRGGKPEEDPF
jgi:hypothetical protein